MPGMSEAIIIGILRVALIAFFFWLTLRWLVNRRIVMTKPQYPSLAFWSLIVSVSVGMLVCDQLLPGMRHTIGLIAFAICAVLLPIFRRR